MFLSFSSVHKTTKFRHFRDCTPDCWKDGQQSLLLLPLLFSVLIPLCHPFFLPREVSKIHSLKLSQDCSKKIP